MTIYATPISEPVHRKGKNEKGEWDFHSAKFIFHNGTLPDSIVALSQMKSIQCNTDRSDLEVGKDYILEITSESIISIKNQKGYWAPGLGSLILKDVK